MGADPDRYYGDRCLDYSPGSESDLDRTVLCTVIESTYLAIRDEEIKSLDSNELETIVSDVADDVIRASGCSDDKYEFMVNQTHAFLASYSPFVSDIRSIQRRDQVSIAAQLTVIVGSHIRWTGNLNCVDVHISFLDLDPQRRATLHSLVSLAPGPIKVEVWSINDVGRPLNPSDALTESELVRLGQKIAISKQIAQLQEGAA